MSSFKQMLEKSGTPVLVDFYADWCQPCRAMAPVLEKLASKLHGKIKIIKVNVDKNPHAASTYGVRGIPAFVLFDKGNIVWRHAGTMSESGMLGQLKPHLHE